MANCLLRCGAELRINLDSYRPGEKPRNTCNHSIPAAQIKKQAIARQVNVFKKGKNMGCYRCGPGAQAGQVIGSVAGSFEFLVVLLVMVGYVSESSLPVGAGGLLHNS
jgi:hypothetical protein